MRLAPLVPVGLLLCILLLAAQFRDAVAQFSAPAANPCPNAGVTVVGQEGVRLTYQGRATDDPAVCLVDGLRIFQNIGLDGDTDRRSALGALVPWQVGHSATTISHLHNIAWREEYRVVDRRRVIVPAGEYQTWVLQYTATNMLTGAVFGRITAFIDVRTGALVRRDVHFVSGFDPNWPPPFEAVSISSGGASS